MVFTSSFVGISGIGALYFQCVLSYGSWFVVQKCPYIHSILFLDGSLTLFAMKSLTSKGLNMFVCLAILLRSDRRFTYCRLFIVLPLRIMFWSVSLIACSIRGNAVGISGIW